VKGVSRWLSLPSNKHWLIIIDNIDRDIKVKDPQAYDVEDYLPEAYYGSIIITSRLASLAQEFGRALEVRRVDDKQAKTILESNARRSVEGQSV